MKDKTNKLPVAPVARKKDHYITIHGDTRNDPYYWMRLSDEQKEAATPDEQTTEVLTYLEAENKYLNQILEPTKQLQQELYDEMVGRIKKDDSSVPYFENGYYYLTRYEKRKEYPVYIRKAKSLESEDELMIDINSLAKNKKYYQAGGLQVSPNNRFLAFGEDVNSRRKYTLRFKDLENGTFLPDEIPNTNGLAVWANDNKTVFYTLKDESLRSYKVFRHVLGTPIEQDAEIYHETDETFRTYVYKSKSKQFIIIGSAATHSNEYRYLSADDPTGEFTVFQLREAGLEYSIAHHNQDWYILTNLNAKNFRIMRCSFGHTQKNDWIDFIGHRTNVLIENMDIFNRFFVITERIKGITQLRIIERETGEEHQIALPEKAHLVYTGKNPEFDTKWLRFNYTSLVTPNSVYDYDMTTRQLVLKKRQEVLGGYDQEQYTSERLMVKASDGTKIPVSLVYKKDTKLNCNTPLLLYGYGAYGISMDTYFSSVRLSLLDRGFIYAIAHVRGGEELGRNWYEQGKMMQKTNTFTDFIQCAEYLIEKNYTNRNQLYAMGGSAGGLLMGAILNMRPELWKGVIAAVPFVDILTTMLDESIPLTTGEFEEWGNPKEEKYYRYIKTYSPYDNIESKDYPALLVTTGYHDSQVQYWEPAKWVAKLRDLKTDSNPLLLYCEMDAGHGGASGRFKRLRETALEYAFLLGLADGRIGE